MNSSRRYVAAVCTGLLLAAACGGGGSSSSKPSGSDDAYGADDKTISTLIEAASGARGKKEDAPGKVRFGNFLTPGRAAISVDVWWGQPDEGDKVTTLKPGEVSAYVTPRRPKGFDSAVYSVTPAGSKEVLWTWDRFSPEKGSQRTVLWYTDEEKFFETDHDESLTKLDSLTNKPQFPEPDAGKVRLRWFVLNSAAIENGDGLLVVASAGKCLTNGSGIADDTGAQVFDESTLQVAPGSSLSLATACSGAPVGDAVIAPAGGRGLLFAFIDGAGKPNLRLVPVAATP